MSLAAAPREGLEAALRVAVAPEHKSRTRRLKILPIHSRGRRWRTRISESGWAREPMTTSAPASSAATVLSSSVMGVDRSSSQNRMSSPDAARTPSRTEAPLPMFCSLRMTLEGTRPVSAARATSAVKSELPSSTTTISEGNGFAAKIGRDLFESGGDPRFLIVRQDDHGQLDAVQVSCVHRTPSL